MTRSRCIVALVLLVTNGIAFADRPSCPPIGDADTHPTFDATLLKEGRFTYRTTVKGKPLGETVIEIRHIGTNVVISMSAPDIAQSWKATVEKSFVPLSASLAMKGKNGPYEMTLRYTGPEITGAERDAGITRPVNTKAEGIVIDQRVDWASMMAANAPAQGAIAMRVFDPSTGLSDMLGHIGDTQPMSGAWGDAIALRLDYTICKRQHLEVYTVYATREAPRTMLREDMPNGLVSELIRIEP